MYEPRVRSGYSLGVGGLVFRDGRVLMVRRMHQPNKGIWTHVSGYVWPDEPINKAIEREVWEETKVRAETAGVIGVRNRVSPGDNNIVVFFTMRWLEGEPQPDGVEVSEAGYFSPDEVATMSGVSNITRLLVARAAKADFTPFVPTDCPPTPGMVISDYVLYLP